ncbi:DUF1176 domain-containing protein [Shigella flexneri]
MSFIDASKSASAVKPVDQERGPTAAQRTARACAEEVAVVNPTPTPLHSKNATFCWIMETGGWNGLRCSLDPLRREANVTALTDDKALMTISREAGAYNTIDLAWIVSRKKPLASRPVRFRVPYNNGQETNELELMNETLMRNRVNW